MQYERYGGSPPLQTREAYESKGTVGDGRNNLMASWRWSFAETLENDLMRHLT